MTKVMATDISTPEGFAQRVRQYQDMAVGYAVSILGDFHLAQDASQEAFIQAYEHLDQLREPEAFGGWLRRIVFKQCDRITRRKRPPLVNFDVEVLAGDRDQPHGTLEAMDMRRNVLEAIRSLPDAIGETTLLYYFADRRQDEIAAFLGVPPGTVKSRLHKGRQLLQEKLLDLADEAFTPKRPSRDRSFVETVMQVIAPNESKHGKDFYAFMDRETPKWKPVSPGEHAEGRIHDSHYDWQTSRMGMKDGQIIGIWHTYDITMRIGSAKVKVAAMNCSRTHDDYQDQDVDLKLANASFDAAREKGYHLALTFEHYDEMPRLQQIGYHDVWRECWWYARTADLPTDTFDIELHEFRYFSDVPEIADIYN